MQKLNINFLTSEGTVKKWIRDSVLCAMALATIIGCGRGASDSNTKSLDLFDRDASRRWRLEFGEVFIKRSECLSLVDCRTTKDPLMLPIAAYEYRILSAYGVQPAFRGPAGENEIDVFSIGLENTLGDAELKPDERSGIQRTLNLLQDQKNLRESGLQIISDIIANKTKPIVKGGDGSFEIAMSAFDTHFRHRHDYPNGINFSDLTSVPGSTNEPKPSAPTPAPTPSHHNTDVVNNVFVDTVNNLIWMPIELPKANWFDVQEIRRQNDLYSIPGRETDPERGCKSTLGPAWRPPTHAEVGLAIDQRIRQTESYRTIQNGWSLFWTSDVERNLHGIAASFDNRQRKRLPRRELLPVVCVASLADELIQVDARYLHPKPIPTEKPELPPVEAPLPTETKEKEG